MDKWKLTITVKIPAGAHLARGGSRAMCENCWDTINSIENCKAYYWKITKLEFNKDYVLLDLLCDHYKLRHGPNKEDITTLKGMQFEMKCLKNALNCHPTYLEKNPELETIFSNEKIEVYNEEEPNV